MVITDISLTDKLVNCGEIPINIKNCESNSVCHFLTPKPLTWLDGIKYKDSLRPENVYTIVLPQKSHGKGIYSWAIVKGFPGELQAGEAAYNSYCVYIDVRYSLSDTQDKR